VALIACLKEELTQLFAGLADFSAAIPNDQSFISAISQLFRNSE
jgi:hypothetical protein